MNRPSANSIQQGIAAMDAQQGDILEELERLKAAADAAYLACIESGLGFPEKEALSKASGRLRDLLEFHADALLSALRTAREDREDAERWRRFDELCGNYLCVFMGDPTTHTPYAMFATDGQAENFANGIQNKQVMTSLRGWESEYRDAARKGQGE